MKANKLICLDIELVQELSKLKNASKLINDLLMDYFFTGGDLKKEELKGKIILCTNEILEKKQQIEGMKIKIKQIDEKDSKIKQIFKGIPPSILEDFKMFPKMTEEVLQTRFREIYSNHMGLEYTKVLGAYKEYFDEK